MARKDFFKSGESRHGGPSHAFGNRSQRISEFLHSRFAFLGLLMLICGAVLFSSVAYVQMVTGSDSRNIIDKGVSRQLKLEAPRGDIVDANGIPLAFSKFVKNIYITNAGLKDDQLNSMLLELAHLLDSYNVKYGHEVDDYMNIDDMTYAMSEQEILEWQQNRNFLALKPLPEGQIESAKDTQFVKPSPKVFYDFLRSTKFKIPDSFSEEDQKKVFRLRFTIYLENWFFLQGKPVLISTDVPEEMASIIAEQNYRYMGVIDGDSPRRQYSKEAQYMGQILGYVGEINQEEYNAWANQGYGYDDVVGKTGIELVTERYLHGINGVKPYNVWTAKGEQNELVPQEGGKAAEPGFDVALTIHPDIQKVAMDALRLYTQQVDADNGNTGPYRSAGCAVMIDLSDGGSVIAMASYPSYDPQDFVDMANDKEAAKRVEENLKNTETKPMINRCISQIYAPGSTFKTFTGVAALESGAITKDTTFYCNHILYVDGHQFRCDGIHYETNINKALAYSCNIFFYHAGMATGIDYLSQVYQKFRLGDYTGIELYGEAEGTRPSRALKASLYDDPGDQQWFSADTAQVSIGQSLNAYTVLQLARATGGIATGKIVSPHIIRQVTNKEGAVIFKTEPKVTDLPFSEYNLQVVRDGMRRVVTDTGSTVYSSIGDTAVEVAGKTGTAETKVLDRDTTNGLFVCFAPYRDPKVAIAIAVESGAHGAATSEIAGKMINAYFAEQKPKEENDSPGLK